MKALMFIQLLTTLVAMMVATYSHNWFALTGWTVAFINVFTRLHDEIEK